MSTDTGEYGLIIRTAGEKEPLFSRFLALLLTYRYGLDPLYADTFAGAYAQIKKHGERIRVAFVVQPKKIESKSSITSLSLDGRVAIFIVLPQALLDEHKILLHRVENIYYCAWETAFKSGVHSLRDKVIEVLEERGIGDLYHAVENLPYDEASKRIESRLRHIKTLPTLPEVAFKIMQLADDPQTSAEQLGRVVTSDPAIVHKLLQIVNSPIFAGAGHKGGWSLQEALVRLGRKKVGAIAQQVMLMNSLVRPDSSQFNLERFWSHSVACALIADRLVQDELVPEAGHIPFNDYWIGALLHDIGKLVLGFFFWSHFEEVLLAMGQGERTFRQAEKELGDVANHEYLSKLLLLKSRAGASLVEAVGTHDLPEETPAPLVCLVHLANNLSKDLGMGYLPGETSAYSPAALERLKLDREDVKGLASLLEEQAAASIEELVRRCVH